MFADKRVLTITLLILVVSCYALAEEAPPDSLLHFWLEPVVVEGNILHHGEFEIVLDKTNHTDLLREHGFAIVNRGPAFASDLYIDGLKRDDIVLRVDGERYPCACPNRMDTPLSRINPLEVCSCEVDKCSCATGSGLGGSVEFRRAEPQQLLGYQVALSGSALGGEGFDGAFSTDWRGYRLTGRHATGGPYEDGSGRDFVELYGNALGFSENHRYSMTEISVFGGSERWRQGASFSESHDVVFPYLLMDERKTEFWSLHSSWRGNKVYLNHTRHLMDSELRNKPMLMVSDADNLTAGITGENYEIFYRNWDIENFFDNPMMHIDNHMIPNLRLFSATVNKHFHPEPGVELGVRLGVQRQWLGDTQRLSFHKALHADAEDQRWFVPFGLMASKVKSLGNDLVAGLQADLGSEPPHPRDLYIAVQKPMNKPWWSGNPELKAPMRGTVRARLNGMGAKLEVYATRIWDYANLCSTSIPLDGGSRAYMSFENIEAGLVGVNLTYERRYLDLRATYTIGKNISEDRPLAEVQPFTLETTVKAPHWRGFGLWLRHVYADKQTRVDTSLSETATPSWYRYDMGLSWRSERVALNLEIENLADEEYSQHLSYQRDPFAAKMRVLAPGRQLRLAVSFRG
ncbi:MAG: TonB-dependent receptor [bacterium]|nr:TonB-dependent receptor [bacterium]